MMRDRIIEDARGRKQLKLPRWILKSPGREPREKCSRSARKRTPAITSSIKPNTATTLAMGTKFIDFSLIYEPGLYGIRRRFQTQVKIGLLSGNPPL
jgi:hypothetical protein